MINLHSCVVAGTDPLDMEATLTSPSGKIDTCEIRDLDDSLCQINFTPSEEGVHTISLKFKGIHFAGKVKHFWIEYTNINLPWRIHVVSMVRVMSLTLGLLCITYTVQ